MPKSGGSGSETKLGGRLIRRETRETVCLTSGWDAATIITATVPVFGCRASRPDPQSTGITLPQPNPGTTGIEPRRQKGALDGGPHPRPRVAHARRRATRLKSAPDRGPHPPRRLHPPPPHLAPAFPTPPPLSSPPPSSLRPPSTPKLPRSPAPLPRDHRPPPPPAISSLPVPIARETTSSAAPCQRQQSPRARPLPAKPRRSVPILPPPQTLHSFSALPPAAAPSSTSPGRSPAPPALLVPLPQGRKRGRGAPVGVKTGLPRGPMTLICGSVTGSWRSDIGSQGRLTMRWRRVSGGWSSSRVRRCSEAGGHGNVSGRQRGGGLRRISAIRELGRRGLRWCRERRSWCRRRGS